MTVRTLLRMGDARLLQPAAPVGEFGTPELAGLVEDMFDTMAAHGGVGLAAPQIGVGLQVVIFGFEHSERYPDAAPVPRIILVNPAKHPNVKADLGQQFVDWVISSEGQQAIASYKIDGQQLFFPNAKRK